MAAMKRDRSTSSPETPAGARAVPAEDWPETVVGGKYVRLLERHVRMLRDESPHGNRQLFLDDVFILSLLAFHNPTLRSLRTREDFSQTRQAQKHLSVRKVCRSTLADFLSLADPDRLRPLLEHLRGELARKHVIRGEADDLHALLKRTVAVDGTFLPALADVAWAVGTRNQHVQAKRYRARVDCQLAVDTFVPELFVIPDPGQSETSSAARLVQPGKLYVYDRGFSGYELINAHYEPDANAPAGWSDKAQFVIRYKPAGGNAPELQEAVEQPLTEVDQQAGVLSDRIGVFHGSSNRHVVLPAVADRAVLSLAEIGRQFHASDQPHPPGLVDGTVCDAHWRTADVPAYGLSAQQVFVFAVVDGRGSGRTAADFAGSGTPERTGPPSGRPPGCQKTGR